MSENQKKMYFKSIGFSNIQEARVIHEKLEREGGPQCLIDELKNKIDEYDHFVEQDTEAALRR